MTIRNISALLILLAAPCLLAAHEARAQFGGGQPAAQGDFLAIPEQGDLGHGPGVVSSPQAAPGTDAPAAQPEKPAAQAKPAQPGLTLPDQPEAKNTKPDAMAMLAKLPLPIQKEIMEEANIANQFCASDQLLGNFYDCSCVALDVIRRRIATGPGNPLINDLHDDDFQECAYGPLAAGYSYNRCTSVYALNRMDDKSRENTCLCVGRAMSWAFSKKPKANMLYVDNLFNKALEICMDKVRSGAFNP